MDPHHKIMAQINEDKPDHPSKGLKQLSPAKFYFRNVTKVIN